MADDPRVTCGLEIHQQLDTGKLFCRCSTALDETIDLRFSRALRPTQSELGEVDAAAMAEARKGRVFLYEASERTACLVEADEEPPHEMNAQALEVALTIAVMTDARAVDEVHTMRKLVIDGSNTTGFQRTALVSMGGHIDTSEGPVDLQATALEEDSARVMTRDTREACYRIDRLGFPLIEIATAPQLHSGEHVREAALAIGMLLRATGKAKRGLGTIRQDLNISTPAGARVEVKGVQDLDIIATAVEMEQARQETLVAVAEKLRARASADELPDAPVDVTELFRDTDAKLVAKAISAGGAVFALALPGFGGVLGTKDRDIHRLGAELSGYARTQGAGGLFHTDELPAYGISEAELEAVHDELGTDLDADAFALVAADADVAQRALEAVLVRARLAFDGVPEETREALPDGTTRYLRPLPGSARMYPETDVPPAVVDADLLEHIRANLPEMPDAKARRYEDELGLASDVASTLARSQDAFLFDEVVAELGQPRETARVLLQTRPELERREVVVSDELVREALGALKQGAFAKEALPQVLEFAAKEGLTVEAAAAGLGATAASEDEVRDVIAEIVERNAKLVEQKGQGAMGALMGEAMQALRGKAEGKTISRLLAERIEAMAAKD